jgi:hypothetical protein
MFVNCRSRRKEACGMANIVEFLSLLTSAPTWEGIFPNTLFGRKLIQPLAFYHVTVHSAA